MNNEVFGERIKRIRMDLGFTQKEFGLLVDNATNGMVSKWESGVSKPNKKRLKLISELAKIDVGELLDESKDPFTTDIDYDFYYSYLEDTFGEMIDFYSKNAEEPLRSRILDIELDPLKMEINTKINSILEFIEADYYNEADSGSFNKYKDDRIKDTILESILSTIKVVRENVPVSDNQVLQHVKQEIIKIEDTLKSYYMDDSNNKYDNNALSLDTYNKISNILKDSIFNLVRLEEYK